MCSCIAWAKNTVRYFMSHSAPHFAVFMYEWRRTVIQNGGYLYFILFVIHSLHWHVQNTTIPCRSQELLPFLSIIYLFCHPSPPTILPSSLTSSCHLFLGLPLNIFVSNSHIILFWEFYFLPFPIHAKINVIDVTLLSLLYRFFNNCINFFIG
jgi:hypothetical protein